MSENQKQSVEGWSERFNNQFLDSSGELLVTEEFDDASDIKEFITKLLSQQQLEVVETIKNNLSSRLEEVDVVGRLERYGAPSEQVRRESTPEWFGRTDELKRAIQSLSTLNINK